MQSRPNSSALLIVLAYVGFISLGLPDAVIGVAWPSVRDTFALSQSALGWVLVATGLGYFATSFLSGRMTQAVGIGMLLTASTTLVAISMLGFAATSMWAVFVACALVHGFGSGGIDAGLNGFAAHHLSARHMNWLHACYCFGAMLGPLLMTAVLTAGRRYSVGYLLVGGLLSVLAVTFLITRRQWGRVSDLPRGAGVGVTPTEALRHPVVVLQIFVFFIYTGLEIALSQWAFTVLTEARGVRPAAAGVAVAVYWASIGVGRVVFGLVAESIGIDALLRVCLLVTAAGATLFALPLGIETAVAGLVLAAVGLAPVFPCLMSRTPQRLGSGLSTHAIGFQVAAAMIGAAAVPATLGIVADFSSLTAVPVGTVVAAVVLWLLHEWLVRQPDAGLAAVR